MNPLLDFSGLPRFDAIKPEHVTSAVDVLLQENRSVVDAMMNDTAPATWGNFVQPLEDAGERLSRAWGQVSHLNAVMNSPELREAYNGNLPRITQFYAELAKTCGYSSATSNCVARGVRASERGQKKVIENELRDFRLGGRAA
jgi:oligopeptidase A